jgi:flagellar basal-body rod modification protein FlgD
MNIAPTTNALPSANNTGSTTPGSMLDMQTFLVLLSVQLSTQNPLEPMSDRDFFAQMAQLGQVQGMDALRGSMDAQMAATMIGKKVTAVRPFTQSGTTDQLVQGTVEKVIFKDGVYYLNVKEANGGIAQVQMGNVLSIEADTPAT